MSSDRDRIRAELEAARGEFHAVLDAVTPPFDRVGATSPHAVPEAS